MAVFKCEMCGGTLEVDENKKIVVCEYCGTKQTLPGFDDEKKNSETDTSTQVEKLFERVSLFLEDGEWKKADEYCEKILDLEPKCAKAYVGKLMAELCVRKQEYLAYCEKPFDNRINYKNAVYFGDEELVEELKSYLSHIKERNKKIEEDNKRDEAKRRSENAKSDNAQTKEHNNNIQTDRSNENVKSMYEEYEKKREESRKNSQKAYILLIILFAIFAYVVYQSMM